MNGGAIENAVFELYYMVRELLPPPKQVRFQVEL